MKLHEAANSGRDLRTVVAALSSVMGTMQRVGGGRRVYDITDGLKGAVYVIGTTTMALGMAWDAEKIIRTIYVWNVFNINAVPAYAVDIPPTGDINAIAAKIRELIAKPKGGKIPLSEGYGGDDFAFAKKAREMYGDVSGLQQRQIADVAAKLNTSIPLSVRNSKTADGRWDLSKLAMGADVSDHTGQRVGAAPTSSDDPNMADALALAKARTVRKLANSGSLVLYGRRPDGTLFEVPGLEEYSANLERLIGKQMGLGKNGSRSMDDQYEMLRSKVALVASKKTANIQAILLCGAPSSGKTHTVMETIKDVGLVEGRDYMVKIGDTTKVALYRTLIEQVDGLTVFDDCDGVARNADAVNLLKGALDTKKNREVSNDKAGGINTATMSEQDRNETVMAVSRILRGKPTAADMSKFNYMLRDVEKIDAEFDDELDPDDALDARRYNLQGFPGAEKINQNKLQMLQVALSRNLPNKVNYRGRIIFISNMEASDWPKAIRDRCFVINMNFSTEEMLDYIDKVKQHLVSSLTEDQKTEVLQYIRELWITGQFDESINFRIVQQAFDLRLTDNWKQMIALM